MLRLSVLICFPFIFVDTPGNDKYKTPIMVEHFKCADLFIVMSDQRGKTQAVADY
mgnify:CR=1 FL=1